MSLDNYKVAIELALVENVTRGLAMMLPQFAKANIAAKELETTLGKMGKLTLFGGGMLMVGGGMLELLKAPLDEAKKFQLEVTKFQQFGLGEKMQNEAVKYAQGMNVIGTSATDAMRHVIEAQGVFREHNLDAAKLAAPVLAKIEFASSTLNDASKEKMHHAGLAMMRWVEMNGGLGNAKKFNELADFGFKMITTSGGGVDWEQLRQFTARSGVAGQNLTLDSMARLEPIINELKGSTAGFALRTSNNRLNGIIKIPNQVAHLLADNNIWDKNKIEWNSQGGIKSFKGNPLIESKLWAQSPELFYEKVVRPMYDKLNLSKEDVGRYNGMIFGSTGGMMANLIDKQWPTMQRSLEAQQRALGIDASVGTESKTADGQIRALEARKADLYRTIGMQLLPTFVNGLEMLSTTLDKITKFAEQHPKLAKFAIEAFAATGALLVAGGALMLLRAAALGLSILSPANMLGGMGKLLVGDAAGGAIAKAFSGLFSGGIVGTITRFAKFATQGAKMFSNAIFMIGRALLMNPIGLAITALVVAGYAIYKNWKEISSAGIKIWADIKTAFNQLFHGDILGALKTFAGAFLMGWQTIFNTVIAMLNKLPMVNIGKFTFADDYRGNIAKEQQRAAIQPRYGSAQTVQVNSAIHMDGKKVAAVVTKHQTTQAGRPSYGAFQFNPHMTALSPSS